MESGAEVNHKHAYWCKKQNQIDFSGDFLRFYDLAVGNSLDDTGERYCHSTPPDFSYNSEIQVLFRSNLDPVVSTGFDCEVVASPVSPVTTIPPPRVSSFAQEACTDVTVSGTHKDIFTHFRSQKTHPNIFSQVLQAQPQLCLQ